MTVMLCRNRVSDFSHWKSSLDACRGELRAAGLHLRDLWRDRDDPHDVFAVFEVERPDQARAFIDGGILGRDYSFLPTTPVY